MQLGIPHGRSDDAERRIGARIGEMLGPAEMGPSEVLLHEERLRAVDPEARGAEMLDFLARVKALDYHASMTNVPTATYDWYGYIQ